MPKSLPVSGSEQPFTNLVYSTRRGKVNNNCYAYALDAYKNGGGNKMQPGNRSPGASLGSLDLRDCADLKRRVLGDGAKLGSPERACPAGHYKIMGFVAPDQDFHWYKQHRDLLVRAHRPTTAAELAKRFGVPVASVAWDAADPVPPGELVLVKGANAWSHKRGFATGPLLDDACGKPIKDPRYACRDYGGTGGANYSQFCGAYCVKGKPRKSVTGHAAGEVKRFNSPTGSRSAYTRSTTL